MMKRKHLRKPLQLSKETVRRLTDEELVAIAAAGRGPFHQLPATCDSDNSCCA
jgi:hypothetical protein